MYGIANLKSPKHIEANNHVHTCMWKCMYSCCVEVHDNFVLELDITLMTASIKNL